MASNSVYVCINHSDQMLKKYQEIINQIFKVIKLCEEDGIPKYLLETDLCHKIQKVKLII